MILLKTWARSCCSSAQTLLWLPPDPEQKPKHLQCLGPAWSAPWTHISQLIFDFPLHRFSSSPTCLITISWPVKHAPISRHLHWCLWSSDSYMAPSITFLWPKYHLYVTSSLTTLFERAAHTHRYCMKIPTFFFYFGIGALFLESKPLACVNILYKSINPEPISLAISCTEHWHSRLLSSKSSNHSHMVHNEEKPSNLTDCCWNY